jgi:hypothetical protein
VRGTAVPAIIRHWLQFVRRLGMRYSPIDEIAPDQLSVSKT